MFILLDISESAIPAQPKAWIGREIPSIQLQFSDAHFISWISVVTKINKIKKIPDFAEQFILHWGEMEMERGINGTMAQIHVLNFLYRELVHTEEICQRLGVARSSARKRLKELQHWGIVHTVSQAGDQRDHFVAIKNAYGMFRIITPERKKEKLVQCRETEWLCEAGDRSPRHCTPLGPCALGGKALKGKKGNSVRRIAGWNG